MKVIFVTIYDALDVRNWSGISYYLSKSFRKAGIEIEFIGDLKSISNRDPFFRLQNLVFNKIFKKKLGSYKSFYEPKNLRFIARQVQERLRGSGEGIIFSPGAIPIAYLNTDRPVVFWSDATFAVMHNYYETFTHLNKRTVKNCHLYEKNAIQRANLAVFSSESAASSSINDYGADPGKVKIIPYGANIELKKTVQDITENNSKKSRSICKLLFIGKDWKRKGAEKAIAVAKELNRKGIHTALTIVGCLPPDATVLPDCVRAVGLIDKSKKEGEHLIEHLYGESHFFILPTVAECTPIVFSEANSFGLPVITMLTGGISSIIKDGINGKMFSPEIHAASWASYIGNLFNKYEEYERLSLQSFNEYITRLNWDVSVEKCISFMKQLEMPAAPFCTPGYLPN